MCIIFFIEETILNILRFKDDAKVSLWTRIFHVYPHSMTGLTFYWKKNFLKRKLESPLILFIFLKENKIRNKTLEGLIILEKTCLRKTKSKSGG